MIEITQINSKKVQFGYIFSTKNKNMNQNFLLSHSNWESEAFNDGIHADVRVRILYAAIRINDLESTSLYRLEAEKRCKS